MRVQTLMHSCSTVNFPACGGGKEGGIPYLTDGDAFRNFQNKPIKVTILGVAPANFIP